MTTTKLLTSHKFEWNKDHSIYEKHPIAGTIKLEIDVDEIFRQLGTKALRNKTGKSIEFSGLIKATRIG